MKDMSIGICIIVSTWSHTWPPPGSSSVTVSFRSVRGGQVPGYVTQLSSWVFVGEAEIVTTMDFLPLPLGLGSMINVEVIIKKNKPKL